ncbi:Por secretion system C-terminal sorting domain-containing protein [Saccharicrinis carchari]|uniref:Por secretion system C-terminal sorting domain-containing protein n=1 Tax=Saccharicrinis carchari TaxID=1168039 RepID=A0A521BU04_SACCC|nr:T9SS type A sorting domain-containing protein [Saccharicrinis carchari]SMO50652.1 Por secretion system C-terminal sorting domain-containing protein [Saccharicrinis carchari]
MKKITFLLLLASICHLSYGQVIADHTVVDKYTDIPQYWIDIVKTKWVSILGASHASAYHRGFQELQSINPNYPVSIQYGGAPLPAQSNALRSNGAAWGNYENATGWVEGHRMERDDWWTNDLANERIKAYLQYCHDNGPELFATMYGWSFDANFDHAYGNGPYGDEDPVYHVKWAGSTRGGEDGNLPFGLDIEDATLIGNRVSMDNYIASVNAYNKYCEDNGIATITMFSTGPVDDNDTQGWNINERGYQQYLKWQYVRDYVKSKGSGYLFDHADILSYNDAGEYATTTWTDHSSVLRTFPLIHPDNMGGDYFGHIGTVGAVRLAKAMWWMLARIAGWDGEPISTTLQNKEDGAGIVVTEQDGLIEMKSKQDMSGNTMSLISVSGQVVQKKMIDGNTCQLNMDSLPSGMYLLVINLDSPYSKKIIKH